MLKKYVFITVLAALMTLNSGCESPFAQNKDIKNSPSPIATATPSPQVQAAQTPTPQATSQPVSTPANSIGITKESFKRVDGSTATIPLSEAVASELLGIKPEEAANVVKHYTTHFAYERLIRKEVDIIFVTEPSKDELELAKTSNLEIEVIPVVKDAFVFLVNKKNPIESLTVKQLQDIYTGKLTNWNQVGGNNGKILAYQRPVNSGSQTLMLSKVMKGIAMVTPEKHMEPSGMGELIEVIASYDNSEYALGYSVYYYANTMYIRDTVKLIGIEGVKPQPDTIRAGKYPLESAYYAVLRKGEPEDSMAKKLLKWVLSEEGQKLAEKAGYISLK